MVADVLRKEAYGALYNWYTVVDSRELCPAGWHTPTRAEWIISYNYLGGEGVGGKMKSTRTEPNAHPRWDSPNTGATNESGFSGLPGGYRSSFGTFYNLGQYGYFWTSTEGSASYAWGRGLIYDDGEGCAYYAVKQFGYSVRCLKD